MPLQDESLLTGGVELEVKRYEGWKQQETSHINRFEFLTDIISLQLSVQEDHLVHMQSS